MTSKKCVLTLLSAVLLLLISPTALFAQTYDGQWTVTENVDGTACGEGNTVETYTATVSQSGSTMTVTASGITRSGSLNGTTLTFSASYPEDGGTLSATGTIVFNGSNASGSSNWTWTNGSLSCSGTSTITATKASSPEPTPTNGSTLSGVILDANGSPVANATVTLTSVSATYTGVTATNGAFSLAFDSSQIPANSAFTVSKQGFIPSALALNIGSSNIFNFGNISLETIGPDVVVLELVPELHHLGDNNFGGAINSAFQKTAEGTRFTKSFSLSTEQLTASSGLITLLAKGLQDNNEVRINGILVGYLNSSPSNGSFGTVTFSNLAMNMFSTGTNTLTVDSDKNGFDYDDFEFTNIVLRFTGISTGVTPTPSSAVSSGAAFANGVLTLPNVAVNSLFSVDYYSLDLVVADLSRLTFSISNLVQLSSATGSPLPAIDVAENILRVPEVYIDNVRFSLTFRLIVESGTYFFQLSDFAQL